VAGSRARVLLLAALLAIAAGAAAWATGALDPVERASVRVRFGLRHVDPPADVAVVAIDDDTFSRLRTRWPFPRSLHATAVDRLRAAGAREVVYDVQFTEPTTPREDMALYRSIQRAGGAVLATSESDGRGHTNVLGGDANLAAIHARAAASNFVNDPGGSIARYPWRVAGLESVAAVSAERFGGRVLGAGAFDGGSAWIDFRGGPGTFPTLSFADVVQGRFDPASVRGKIVVVGASAPTLQDVHATPVGGSRLMSGPEVQANAIWTALHGNPLRSAPGWLDLLLLVAFGALPFLARLRLGLGLSALAAWVAAGLYAVVAQVAFGAGLVLAVAGPLATLGIAAVAMVVASHLMESRERRRVSRDNEVLEERVRERTEELRETQIEIISRLGAAVESRDAETGSHIERISFLAQRLALAVGLSEHDAERIGHASAMHDIGKIGIPDSVLLKPAALDATEWELMQTHTTVGATVLSGSRSSLVRLAEVIALTHHERWDGSGYPFGLRGEKIPLAGRICAICDVYDALTSKRPYKDASSPEDALGYIRRASGSHFDPELAEAFLHLAPGLIEELAEGAHELGGVADPGELSALSC
jgi:response regulator RpfG family c-di-GMP phosphodiesterase